MDWPELIQSWGPAGAVVCGMGYITHRFLVFLGNHLTEQAKALMGVCESLRAVEKAVEDCPKRK